MEQVSYTLRLDLKDTGIVNTGFRLKQGDSGMKISVSIFNRGVNVFDSTTVPKIVFKRPDGASVMANMTVGSSVYEYVFVGNELQQPGVEIMDVKFTLPNDRRESSVSCSFVVVPDTITPNTHGSDIYDNDLAELVAEATAAAETVEEVVGDSEAWAVGERNGVPVGPEDPAYHNNSKYWSEQANVTSLAALTDVELNNPADNDGLVYNGTAQKWGNKQITTKEQWKKNGAYNDLPNNGVTQVVNGLTFTFNPTGYQKGVVHVTGSKSDGIGHAVDMGTSLGDRIFTLKAGTYKILDGVSASNTNLGLELFNYTTSATIKKTYDTHAEIFTLSKDTQCICSIVFRGAQNTAFDDYMYPMITTDLNATYDDYVPYAKTNRELTEYATTKKGSLSPSQYTTSADKVLVKQVGNTVHIWGYCSHNIQNSDGNTNNVIGTITGVGLPGSEETVRNVCGIAAHAYDLPQQVGYIGLSYTGELIFKTTQTGTKVVYFDISYAV